MSWIRVSGSRITSIWVRLVEREDDIDQFIKHTGEHVGFVVDTGHAALGGVDAVKLIRSHPKRVTHIHAKVMFAVRSSTRFMAAKKAS